MAEPQSDLPTGAYITIGLLIALAALLSWLIASYPDNPSERSIADNCEAVAQQYSKSKQEGDTTGNRPAGSINDKAAPNDAAADQTKSNIDPERQIAKYNCQLAIYTRDLANFTKWLVYATTGLIVIGLLQGFFLQRSVRVADRAATEALDAIRAAQTAADASTVQAKASTIAADAAMKHVAVAEDSAKRQLRAYVSVRINGLVPQNRVTNYPYEIRMLAKNTGHTPAHAIRIATRLKIFPAPLPSSIDLSLSAAIAHAAAHLNPGQECFFRARLNEMISDAEISEITKENSTKKMYIFGTIYYRDAFGEERRTNFCQYGMWDINGRFAALNTGRHNDAT